MSVCIISNVDDAHAILVESALISKGATVTKWHWADFPSVTSLSVQLSTTGELWLPVVQKPLREVSLWVHRGFKPEIPLGLHSSDVLFARRESKEFLDGILAELGSEAFCVNPPAAARRWRSKASQMALAGKCGFLVPPSLYSNDPVSIRQFFTQHDGKVIVKHSIQQAWEDIKTKKVFLPYTSRISADDITNEAQLSACPSIFQKEIEKAFELRVLFMGATVFAVKIDQREAQNAVDWRQEYRSDPPCTVFQLPDIELKKIQTFIRVTQLRYGSIDIIVDWKGQYVFLEVNETGQFLWMEKTLPELLLLDCFSEFLIARDPEFLYYPGKNAVRCSEFAAELSQAAIDIRIKGHVAPQADSNISKE